jgi:ATP-binding cassette subfamily B protein
MSSPLVDPARQVLRTAVRGQARPLAGAATLAVTAAVVELAAPWPVSFAVDHVIDGRPVPQALDVLAGVPRGWLLTLAAGALVCLAGATAVLDARVLVLGERSAERVVAELRASVLDRALALSPRWHQQVPTGELVSRLTSDTGRVGDTIVLAVDLAPDVVVLAGTLTVLAVLDPWLALAALSVLPPLATAAVRQRRLVRLAEQDARAAGGRLAAGATDVVRNLLVVQAFGQRRRASALVGRHVVSALEASLTAITTRARWAPRAEVLLAAGSGSVLMIGTHRVLAGALSTGTLLVVLAYVRGLYRPVRSLARSWSALAKAAVSWRRVAEVIASVEQVPEPADPTPMPTVRSGIRFRDVHFGYRPDRRTLRGVDLEVRAGECVCVVGPSGAGKSTLLWLLLRIYDVDGGQITLDGVDVRRLPLRDLRRRIALVPQDPWLLDSSIADNIVFGATDPAGSADRHGLAVLTAGRAALVEEFVRAMPEGYTTRVGEGGGRLSVGQRRRVAIARALVGDPAVLLLDEPTASLDGAAAAAVIRGIRRAADGRTVLMVSHDPALIRIADRVVELTAAPGEGHRATTPDRPGHRPAPDEIGREVNHDAHSHVDQADGRTPRPLAQPVPEPVPQPFA